MSEKVHLPVIQDEPSEPAPEPPPLVLPPREPPRTRADCQVGGTNSGRPCPWVMCKHNLVREIGRFLVDDEDFKLAPESCVLDVAERGGATLEEVGVLLDLTRERIRQIEQKALRKLLRMAQLRPDLFDGVEVDPAAIKRKLFGGLRGYEP